MKLIQNPIGTLTLFKRECDRFLKIYLQTLISPILSNLLFLGVFGGVFAARAGAADTGEYLSYIVPGLCAMGTITSAYSNPAFSVMIQKYQGFLQDLNMIPLSDIEKTLAIVLAGALRGTMVGLLTYIASIPFVGFSIVYPLFFIVCLFMIGLIFSSLGLILGLSCRTFDGLNFALSIVFTPLLFMGGVFFDITKLPGIFAQIAPFNPAYPIVSSVRFFYSGGYDPIVLIHVSFVLLVSIISLTTAYIWMRRGVGLRT